MIAAGAGGKWKTALQMVGVLCLILHFPHRALPFYQGMVNLNVVGLYLVVISLVFGVTSAIEYTAIFAKTIEARDRRAVDD